MSVSKLVRVMFLTITVSVAMASTASATLFCESVTTNGGICEAQPQGPGFTYVWTTTGSAFLTTPAPPTQPVRTAACLPESRLAGSVQVEIIFPDGSRITRSRTVCSLPDEEDPLIAPN